MITRQDYMSGKATHSEYYREIAIEIGVGPAQLPAPLAVIREKLLRDPHLNNIPLSHWDARVSGLRGANAALKARGDWLSLGTGVCILKEYARYLDEQAAKAGG